VNVLLYAYISLIKFLKINFKEIKYESSSSVAVNVVNPTTLDSEDKHFSIEIIISNFKKTSIFILDNLYYEV